jgi:hypothetical protein
MIKIVMLVSAAAITAAMIYKMGSTASMQLESVDLSEKGLTNEAATGNTD